MLVFEERGNPEYPEENLSEQSREPTTNSTHILRWVRKSSPGHTGGRQGLSPPGHPCFPKVKVKVKVNSLHAYINYFIYPRILEQLMQLLRACNNERYRPPQRKLRHLLFSCVGSFTSHRINYQETTKSKHLQTSIQRQHFLLNYLKTPSVGPGGV